jgi:hypothetical protein
MGGIFKTPKPPKAPEPVKAPTVDEAEKNTQEMDRLRRRRGRRANILTSPEGDTTNPNTGSGGILGGY